MKNLLRLLILIDVIATILEIIADRRDRKWGQPCAPHQSPTGSVGNSRTGSGPRSPATTR